MFDSIHVQSYLKRLHYTDTIRRDLPCLQALHRQHLLTIPLENLDIHYRQAITLDVEKIYQKLIINHRGGFCYELNGLFYELLQALGFTVKRISGRVYVPGKGFKDEFDHLAIVVQLGPEQWLADVGLGRMFPMYPLQISLNEEQSDETGAYRITIFDSQYLAVEKKQEDGHWLIAYIFTSHPRELEQFSGMCSYHQTSPESYFTQNKLCSIAIPHGRMTITDKSFTYTKNADVVKQEISGTDEFETLLLTHFGIQMKHP